MSEEYDPLSGDNRPIRYVEPCDGAGERNEKVVYRASSLGSCERALVAAARGHMPSPKPDWFQEVLDEGHVCEPQIKAMYTERTGAPISHDQHEGEFEVGEIDGRLVVVRFHTDGLTYPIREGSGDGTAPGFGEAVLFEAKKFRASTWEKFQRQGVECNTNYPWQVSAMMWGLGIEECEFVGGLCEFDDWNEPRIVDIDIKHLAPPPLPRKALTQRVVRLERLINTGFDAPEVDCSKSMFPCPYWKFHDEDDEDFELPGEVYGIVSQLEAVSAEVKNLGAAKDRADKRKKDLAAELRAEIEKLGPAAEGAKKLLLGDVQITRIRKHVPAHQVKASDQDYFTIKRVKQQDKTEEES